MKKLLISFCAASLLAASVIGYAGTVTFVNDYRQAVNFTASSGYMYNPVAQGTVLPGGQFTFQVNGAITPNYNFMAYAPAGSNVVTGCGYIGQTVWDVTVRAGWSNETGRFGCWVYPTPMFMPVKHTTTSVTSTNIKKSLFTATILVWFLTARAWCTAILAGPITVRVWCTDNSGGAYTVSVMYRIIRRGL